VKFTADATIAEVSELLSSLGGTISDGPSALGLMRLSFPDLATRDAALAALSGRSDLIELVAEQ